MDQLIAASHGSDLPARLTQRSGPYGVLTRKSVAVIRSSETASLRSRARTSICTRTAEELRARPQVQRQSPAVNSRTEPIALTADDLLIQWSINVDCVTAWVAVVRQVNGLLTEGRLCTQRQGRSTEVLPKIPHCNSSKSVPNQPLRGRRGRFGTLLQQLECGNFGRTAV